MKSYLSLASKYLTAHKKKTRLVIISVALSVALVTGIFSMLDFFLQFEKIQQIHEYGNYHLGVKDATNEEKQAITSRMDVKNAGTWISFRNGNLNGKECRLAAVDQKFAPNMQITLLEGRYPVAENEMILEAWAAENLHLKVGDVAKITFAGNTEKKFVISGICSDYGNTKAKGMPGVYLSIAGANEVNAEKSTGLLIEFKDGININDVQKAIQSSLKLADSRIIRNEYLLSVMGYGKSNTVIGLYSTGAVLFCIILIAGVMMIYNTFNISVMERVQQFGLLRCIGASRSQIKKLVKREGLHITLRAIPIGVLAGMLLAFLCCGILKYYNRSLFGEMPLFNFSIAGTIAGIAIGVFTVFIASSRPAKKAARVSPVNAATGSNEIKISKKKKQGRLTKMFHVEVAMGINNAVVKKKTLFLMSCSIAISIVLFLGFQVFVDFMHSSLKTTKPYTPDISLTSEQGLSNSLYEKLSDLSGIKKVYGRMFGYVDATFHASRLTDAYKQIIGNVQVEDNGLFIPPEKSWLISYDKNQLNWAKTDLIEGELSEEKLNVKHGIIAVAHPLRNGVSIETAALQLGDKVYIQTPDGTKEMTVMAILRTVPFNDSVPSLTTFITTEKLFTELTGESTIRIIDIQLDSSGQEQTVSEIKGMLDDSIAFYDQRQKNAEINGYFLTMAVFIYGFVAVIALISVLNIVNTMNTSVASKTRYLGVMRAVGMSGAQLDKMVLVEALTYSLTGCIVGCIMGIALQKVLIYNFLPRLFTIWKFPYVQIVLILILILLVTVISIISPLKRIKAWGIAEIIS
ncbi:MAG: FtsX-like permease family protein [Clostridiales bacterium]|jgi:putative ABC transport system permease protein|nr:FtsX-like permease family protein [Eubacteriales bacterium]MDH7566009.1 FtsX-like permease family protein [Clostridiales bacterium]